MGDDRKANDQYCYRKNKQFNGIMGNDLKACESYDAFFEGLLREAV